MALARSGYTLLALGQRRQAEEAFSELRALATRTGNIVTKLQSLGTDSYLALVEGRFDEAAGMFERAIAFAEQFGTRGMLALAPMRASIHLGASVESFLPERSGGLTNPSMAVLYAHLGRQEEASRVLDAAVVRRPGFGTREDESSALDDILYLEASVLLGHCQVAEMLLKRLAGAGYVACWAQPTCTSRHLGGAAALLGRHDEARRHYLEAIRVCTEMRFRPELALTRLQLAELLLEHYPSEKKDALEHLDFAIKEFREMKMQPSLERVLRHKEILKA